MAVGSRYTPGYSRRRIFFPRRSLSDVTKHYNYRYFGKIAHDVITCSSLSIRQDVIRNWEGRIRTVLQTTEMTNNFRNQNKVSCGL